MLGSQVYVLVAMDTLFLLLQVQLCFPLRGDKNVFKLDANHLGHAR